MTINIDKENNQLANIKRCNQLTTNNTENVSANSLF